MSETVLAKTTQTGYTWGYQFIWANFDIDPGFPQDHATQYGFMVAIDAGYSVSLESIKLYLARIRTPGGDCYVYIKNVTDGLPVPSNTPYTNIDSITRPTTDVVPEYDVSVFDFQGDGDWYTFTFDEPITLEGGSTYFIGYDAPMTWTGLYTTMEICGWGYDYGNTYSNEENWDTIHDSITVGSTYYDNGQTGWYPLTTTIPFVQLVGTVSGGPPTKAKNPTPTDTNSDVVLSQNSITWEDGGGADTFDVYYGTTSGDLVLVSSAQAGTSFVLWGATNGSPFDYVVTRYWRIDSTNEAGTTTGDEWSFTTMSLTYPTPNPPDPDPYPPGHTFDPNFLKTTTRLICAGNDQLWYEV